VHHDGPQRAVKSIGRRAHCAYVLDCLRRRPSRPTTYQRPTVTLRRRRIHDPCVTRHSPSHLPEQMPPGKTTSRTASSLFCTHTHPFNGPVSRTTWVSQYQKGKTNLDFTEARDSEWQWHQLGRMQVCISLQKDNHASTPPLVNRCSFQYI